MRIKQQFSIAALVLGLGLTLALLLTLFTSWSANAASDGLKLPRPLQPEDETSLYPISNPQFPVFMVQDDVSISAAKSDVRHGAAAALALDLPRNAVSVPLATAVTNRTFVMHEMQSGNVAITGPATGATNHTYMFRATVGPVTATLPITYAWQTIGQSPLTHTSASLTDVVTFTWTTTGTYAITVTAVNATGIIVTATHSIAIDVGAWVIECVDCPHYFTFMTDSRLLVDSEGHSHMAYGGDHLYYAWHDGANWHSETADDAPQVGQYASLVLDGNGYPHISYYDELDSNLKYAYRDATGWHVETVDTDHVGQHHTSLALDASGYPHIGYYCGSTSDLKYAYLDAYGWHIETVDSDGIVGVYASLSLDSNGYPHIAYNDNSNYALKYAYQDGTGWHIETVEGGGNGSAYLSMALAEDDYAHISYQYHDSLKYAYLDASGWHSETVDSSGVLAGKYTSLVLDGNGYPHISYNCHNGGGGTFYLKYAYQDIGGWHLETVDDSPQAVGDYTSLALDRSGYPHISYFDNTNRDLKYAYWDGAVWLIEVMDNARRIGAHVSLALDENGHPHIGYEGNYNLQYAHWDGTAWHNETVESGQYTGRFPSLAVDGKGDPHISHYDGTSDGLRYTYRDTLRWYSEIVDSTGDVGQSTSLALDGSDYPHISYYDYTNENLKYAYWDGASWHIETVSSMGYVQASTAPTSLALDQDDYPHISYYSATNKDMMYIYQDATGWHTETVDSEGDVGTYASLALDENGYPHISYIAGGPDVGLKYAYRDASGWHSNLLEIGSSQFTYLAIDEMGYPHISYYYNPNYGDLKYAYQDGAGWHIETLDSEGAVGPATSLDLDESGHPHISYQDQSNSDLKYAHYSTIPFAPVLENIAITGSTTGILDTIHTFTAAVNPTVAIPITYVWQATGQAPVTHTSDLRTDMVTFIWGATGTQAITVTATNAGGTVSATHAIIIGMPSPSPNLNITKSVEPATDVSPGSIVTYTIFLINSGDAIATGVVLTDVLPLAVDVGDWIECTACGSMILPFSDDAFSWGPNTIAPDESHTFRFTAIVTTNTTYAGATVINTAELVSGNAGSSSVSVAFTIAGTSPSCPFPLTGAAVDGPTSGYTDTLYAFTGVISPIDSTQPVTYTWSPAPDNGQGDGVASYRWNAPGSYIITLAAKNCGGLVSATHTIAISAPGSCDDPLMGASLAGPGVGQIGATLTFTASPQPANATLPVAYTWSSDGLLGGQGSSQAAYRWDSVGSKSVLVTARNCGGQDFDASQPVLISSPSCPRPLSGASLVGPAAGVSGTLYSFMGIVTPTDATTPVSYTWSPAPKNGQGTAVASYRWDAPTVETITLAAENCAVPLEALHVITIAATPPPGDAYEMDDACGQARPIPTDGTLQEHNFHVAGDSDWVSFHATSGAEYLIEAVTPSDSSADVSLELYESCGTVPTRTQDHSFSPDVRLRFTAPGDGVLYLRTSNSYSDRAGPDVTYHVSVRSLAQSATPGAIVIVAGRLRLDDTLQRNIHNVTNEVYNLFLEHGYSKDRIYYLATNTSMDADGNGYPDDVDLKSSHDNLQKAITEWATDASLGLGSERAFTLYLMDHGGVDRFYLDGSSQTVDPHELDSWLDTLEAATGARVNVIMEACHSGSFLAALGQEGRVVIASTARRAVAYATQNGARFSDTFLESLQRGLSLYNSFEEARWMAETAHPDQAPWLDDDGDGIWNHATDGQEAARRGFAYAGTFGPSEEQWPPYVVWARVDVENGEHVIKAQVEDNHGNAGVNFVWAVMYEPSYTPPPGDTEEMPQETLPTAQLQDPDGDGIWEAIEQFDELGEYRLVIYAADDEDLSARPKELKIRTGWQVYLPLVIKQ